MSRARPNSVFAILLALFFAVSHTAAQGVLTSGTSALPSCAQSCGLLNQAAQACSGASSATQTVWICFCQSAYLKTLYDSPDNICQTSCDSASDNQKVMNWYNSNCGTDNGASEHPQGAATPSSGAAPSSSTTATTGSSGSSGSSGRSGGNTWWDTHYKWVIMIIVIALGLGAAGAIGVWLKRRHQRKQDQIRGGFNAGITERAQPMSQNKGLDSPGAFAPTAAAASGSNSPARTRDAFMPYGYGYSRSESHVAPQADDRRSPMTRGGSPYEDLDREASRPMMADRERNSKKAVAHERSLGEEQ